MNNPAKIAIVAIVLLWSHGAVALELPDGLYAQFETSMGSFTARLDYVEAPMTCANFAGLAEGSQNWIDPLDGRVRNDPYYDGLVFHRVIDDFVIQGGCPLGTGTSGPGYAIVDEFGTNLTHHSAGILSMANSGVDTGGSQFFITLKATPWLDNKHAVFGEVVDGMNGVVNIGKVDTGADDRPLIPVVMNQVRILRIGMEAAGFDPRTESTPKVMPLVLSITNSITGMEVGCSTSNQCEQSIYSSTNLVDWTLAEKKYWPSENGLYALAAATNRPTEFFRAARIFYPLAIAGLATDITGHKLEFTQGISEIVFLPQAGGVGTCSISRTPDVITAWGWWPDIRAVTIKVYTAGGRYFAFQINHGSPSNGTWNGYEWLNGAWQHTGEWSYSDTPPIQ